jgi:hypothetical protein
VKPRRVVVTVEMETDAPIEAIRRHCLQAQEIVLGRAYRVRVLQVQVNAIVPARKVHRRRSKKP